MNTQELDNIGSMVAVVLSDLTRDNWVALERDDCTPSHGVYLSDGNVTLWMRQDYQTGPDKLACAGSYPGPLHNVARHDKGIKFSATRTPSAIAGEIMRRLLDAVREETTRARDQLARETREAGERARVVAQLSEILGGYTRDNSVSWSPDGPGYGTFEVGYNGATVHLERFSVPVAFALDIARVLMGQGVDPAAGMEG